MGKEYREYGVQRVVDTDGVETSQAHFHPNEPKPNLVFLPQLYKKKHLYVT